ncbi:MAG TPA: M20 family metallopeptidase [Stellaceae bacterium]|nr:M20 family metallopeptidase [Stellaceae bacterium]
MVDDLARLIAVDTAFPPGDGYPAFADLLQELLQPLGFAFRRVVVPRPLWHTETGGAAGERTNLIATRRTDGRPVCSLYYHVDTVPAGAGWTRPPLTLTRDGDRLIGRGTADMKGTIAATLLALRAADACGVALAYDPILLFCTDEEGGLYPGIRYLAEQHLIEGHLLSFNGGAAPRIWAGCFGSVDLVIRVTGRSAHSGEGLEGINAIEEAVPLLVALMDLKTKVEARVSALPPPPHYAGRQLHARLTIAAAHGGQKGSSLPGALELIVNRRYLPEERFATVLDELRSTIEGTMADSRALGLEIETIGHLPPVDDPTGPHWPRWVRAVSEGFGFPVESFVTHGASSSSDMGWAQQAGVREILLGGLVRPTSRHHAADEFTTIDDVTALARAILLYLSRDFAAEERED